MALNLSQICYDALQLVPCGITAPDQQDWIDLKQRQLYNEFRLPIVFETYTPVAGQAIYVLDPYIMPYRIKTVVVGGQEYKFYQPEDRLHNFVYYAWMSENGPVLWLYPPPGTTVTGLIMVNFEDGPNICDHTVAATTVPRFLPDYHQLFVEDLAEHHAFIRKDGNLVNVHHAKYQEIYAAAQRYNKPKLKQFAECYRRSRR